MTMLNSNTESHQTNRQDIQCPLLIHGEKDIVKKCSPLYGEKNTTTSQGLGLLMYELTILHRGKLATDYVLASDHAKKVWTKLAEKYDNTKKGKFLTVYK
jgi:hypothetical protein